ncbi:hypothetical protein K458DRAFT_122366 [Lentithecium fluviatile CBS 122367]|uniref:Small ribosomal subunit protein uS10m n=1 Tax=Lentithecium fluviatile CBS 122367 TaxID=1168545 RepID=A0A6G1ILA4_9PLEO|nr:hypothetical protein K458DRAFT_122366 [Lentithecium fluviatile CBS 122367]
MATPRCTRSIFASASKVRIASPRSCARPFSQTTSPNANENYKRAAGSKRGEDGVDLYREIESGSMGLDERVQELGLDPQEYRKLLESQKKLSKKSAEWEPKDREEANRKWKKLQQDAPDHLTLLDMYRKEGLEIIKLAKERGITLPTDKPPLDPKSEEALSTLRTPINVQAVHLRPLRRTPQYGVPVCDLQLRTYSIRNLLLFADFAVRAAYYMGLCARGPIPLPRITERWTVPRANFIFKKSQENFERITMRRLVQIQDGHPDVVKAWLAFLQKHQYYGVGMKANIWEYESLDAATRAGYTIEEGDYSRRREGPMLQKVDEILKSKGFKEAMKGYKSPVELRP